jgi:lysophospholipase L1-like esterase
VHSGIRGTLGRGMYLGWYLPQLPLLELSFGYHTRMKSKLLFICLALLLISTYSWPWAGKEARSNKTSSKKTSKRSSSKDAKDSKKSTDKKLLLKPRSENASTTHVRHPFDEIFLMKVKSHIQHFKNLTKLIFLGDSLLHHAAKNTSVWEPLEVKYGAVSLAGIGDRTENILTRLSKGVLRNITSNPLVVVMCGESNAAIGDSPAAIVRGISAIVDRVRKDLSRSDVIVLSMIPNARIDKSFPTKSSVYVAVNKELSLKYSKGPDKRIKYVDISGLFLKKNVTNRGLYSPDGIHPNSQGYEIIMRKLQPYFDKLPDLHLPKTRFKDLRKKFERMQPPSGARDSGDSISSSRGDDKNKKSSSKSRSKSKSKSKSSRGKGKE